MTAAPLLEGGFAEIGPGAWLLPLSQPAARLGMVSVGPVPRLGGTAASASRKGISGFFRRLLSPDRGRLRVVAVPEGGRLYCSDRSRPFLARLDAGAPISVVSEKLLLAPASSRACGRLLRVIPFSLRAALCITEFASEWVVVASASRVRRAVVPEGGTLAVRPEALVAWSGPAPTGTCGRLRTRDLFLPRLPQSLALDFHGPCIVWFEGSAAPSSRRGRS